MVHQQDVAQAHGQVPVLRRHRVVELPRHVLGRTFLRGGLRGRGLGSGLRIAALAGGQQRDEGDGEERVFMAVPGAMRDGSLPGAALRVPGQRDQRLGYCLRPLHQRHVPAAVQQHLAPAGCAPRTARARWDRSPHPAGTSSSSAGWRMRAASSPGSRLSSLRPIRASTPARTRHRRDACGINAVDAGHGSHGLARASWNTMSM